MELIDTSLKDCYLISHSKFEDDRGYFKVTYSSKVFNAANIDCGWLQENESLSDGLVCRGLHIQPNYPQSKYVSVKRGKIADVAVDLRADSPTFGKYEVFHMSSDDDFSLYIPAGFAHGFITKTDETIINYKIATNEYMPSDEVSIYPFDESLNIDKFVQSYKKYGTNMQLSQKDANGMKYSDYIKKYC